MKNNLGNVNHCKALIRHGEIMINYQIVTDVKYKVKNTDMIMYHQRQINAQPFIYYMMNKPSGYICANHDKQYQCVIDLIDTQDCYCLGRLDIDTTGLLIITNDVSLSKKLLLPQNHVSKKYLVSVAEPLTFDLIDQFDNGIMIDQNVQCQTAKLEILDDYHCYVTISEGKYHQIKKMFLSCDNQVVKLKRVTFCGIELDKNLKIGEYRLLTLNEIEQLLK